MRAIIFLPVGLILTIGCSNDEPSTMPRNHAPQITGITASPDSIGVSGSTTLTCTAIDADGDSLHYIWSSLLGSFPNGVTSASAEWLAPATVGDYTIHLNVSDGVAKANSSKAVKVTTSQIVERNFPMSTTTIRMCWIPAGSFNMGSPDNEQGRSSNEGPVHQVTFAQGFWLSKYEITQAQWQAVMGNNPSNFRGNNLPVETVSWDDIQGFESALGGVFRLPSESEWEYACRAGTTTRLYWGDDANYSDIGTYAWHDGNSDNTTHPVGTKTANAWGLCDMSGNVWEWCEDDYHIDYSVGGRPDNGAPWTDAPRGGYGVLRGGSWYGINRNYRSAVRDWDVGPRRFNHGGFRVAADFPSP